MDRKIALPFVEKHNKMSKHSLAKLLFENFPELFDSSESARNWLRLITGNRGNSRTGIKVADTFGVKLPEEVEEEEMSNFVMPFHNSIGIINDIHSLYYEPDALYPALEYLKRHNAEAILINGDMLDFYQLSSFSKDPSKSKFGAERQWGIQFLQILQENFGNVYYKFGNHEYRYKRYMMKNASAVFDDKMFDLENLLHFEGSKVKFIGYKQLVIFGKLAIIHGDEIRAGGVVNVARTKMLRAFANIAFGHHHKTDTSIIRDIYGDNYASYSIGCLCKLKAAYDPFNQWNNGFAFVELIDSSGKFKFHNKMIIDGEVV